MHSIEFLAQLDSLLTPIRTRPGVVFNSAFASIRPGNIYFLGINPAGDPLTTLALGDSVAHIADITSNAYVDGNWSSTKRRYAVGQHPIQKGAKALLAALGEKPEEVCASNLMFCTTAGEEDAGYPEMAEICWPIHQLVMGIVKPKCIVTFGAKPFDFVYQKLMGGPIDSISAGHGKLLCRSANLTTGELLIGVPHLSRYSIVGKEQVFEWIRQKVFSAV